MKRSTGVRGLAVMAALVFTAAACGDTSSDEADAAGPSGDDGAADATTTTTSVGRVPLGEWDTTDPASVGLDADALAELDRLAEEADSNCLLVVRDGALVHERYWGDAGPDDDQEIFSATKSATALIVGIAEDQGYLSLDEPASTYLTEWEGTASESVTIRDLLTNTSGRFHDFQTDFPDLGNAEDRSAFAVGLEQEQPPNTEWIYNNAAIQTLEEIVERAVGQDFGEFAEANLFAPLGMSVEFSRDVAGNPTAYFGLQAGCRDMARLGLLMLRGGTWGDEQVVDSAFAADATSPSTDLNAAYGYLWWLNAESGWVHPSPKVNPEGTFWPDAPLDAYAALGLGEQITLVLPELDTVVVRLGGPGTMGFGPDSLVNRLAGATVAASTS